MELAQAMFSITPEALDAVDVACAMRELVRAVVDSVMLAVAHINQPIVATPPVRMGDRFRRNPAPNDRLQRGFPVAGDDLRVNASVSIQESEDRRLAACAVSTFASHPTRTEVELISFDPTARERRGALLFSRHAPPNFEENHRHTRAHAS